MRLGWLLAALWISSIAGAVVIAALSLGWVGRPPSSWRDWSAWGLDGQPQF